MPRARCKADGSVPRTSSVPTMCQVFVGVDGRGPRLLGRDPENQSLGRCVGNCANQKKEDGEADTFSAPPVCQAGPT